MASERKVVIEIEKNFTPDPVYYKNNIAAKQKVLLELSYREANSDNLLISSKNRKQNASTIDPEDGT